MTSTNIEQRISELREYIEKMQLPIEKDMSDYVLKIQGQKERIQDNSAEASIVSSFNVIYEESFYAAICVIPDAIETGLKQTSIRYDIWRELFQYFYINDEIDEDELCKNSNVVNRTLSIYCDLFWNDVSQFTSRIAISEEGDIKINGTFSEFLPDVVLYSMQEAVGGELAVLTCFHYLANNWLYRVVSPERSANAIEFLIRVWNARQFDELKLMGVYYNGKSWCAATDENMIRKHIEIATPLLIEKGCQNHLNYVEKQLHSKAFEKIWRSDF